MTAEEFLKCDPKEIRYNADLLDGYINLFVSIFDKTPSCAACTFSVDHRKLKNKLTHNIKDMSKPNQTFKLHNKDRFSIARFNGVAKYLRDASDEEVLEYLKAGTGKDIAARKAKFKVLPQVNASGDIETIDLFGTSYNLEQAQLIFASSSIKTGAKTISGLQKAFDKATPEEQDSVEEVILNQIADASDEEE